MTEDEVRAIVREEFEAIMREVRIRDIARADQFRAELLETVRASPSDGPVASHVKDILRSGTE